MTVFLYRRAVAIWTIHTSILQRLSFGIQQRRFSILVRRLLKRGNFTSTEDLKQQILSFISYFNQTMAKPFRWTYKGRPLVV